MTMEKERSQEARLAARLESLQEETKAVANTLGKEGYPEESIAALLSAHEMLNRIMGSKYIDDPRQDAQFIRAFHDGIRGIYDGLLMGKGHERTEQHRQIAEHPTVLREEFRKALKNANPKGTVGPTETTMTSETVV